MTAGICGMAYLGRLGDWPWDVDELSSLEEMRLLDPGIRRPVYHPESIVVRLPRLVPVWYGVQKLLLRWLPVDPWGTRLLSAGCGVASVLVLYGWGWRWRGLMFGAALALLAGGSLLVLWLAQQNRFYTMALLWIVLAMAAIWTPSKHWGWLLGTAVFTLLAVFTHNVAIVLFGIQAGVVLIGCLLGGVRLACALRAGVSGILAAAVYGLHVRPIAGRWTEAGFTWAPPWASFVAHVGMPTVVLALFGTGVALLSANLRRQMGVWAGLTVGVFLFVLLVPWVMPVWNPRYSLLWILPLWVTGALAVETVARALFQWASSSEGAVGGSCSVLSAIPPHPPSGGQTDSHSIPPSRSGVSSFSLFGMPLLPCLVTIGWYGCVGLLLAPKWFSHWRDGTRHDYRQAAQIVVQCLHGKKSTDRGFQSSVPSEASPVGADFPSAATGSASSDGIWILTNMELQMRYYLPEPFRSQCRYWIPSMPLPEGDCLVVLGGNGWEPPLVLPDRQVQWMALVGRRRLDELSYMVRIYWVSQAKSPESR